MKNPRELVRTRILRVSLSVIIVKSKGTSRLSHTVNTQIGVGACLSVERTVKRSLNLSVIWKEEGNDKIEFVIGFLQIYLDKSQTSMSTDSYFFYSLHIMLHQFNENIKQKGIALLSSIVAYLSVNYSDE